MRDVRSKPPFKQRQITDRTGINELLSAFLEDYIGRTPKTPELDYWPDHVPKEQQQFQNLYDEFLLKYGKSRLEKR
jgi:hypothetical protein